MLRHYQTLHTFHIAVKCCYGCTMLSDICTFFFLDIIEVFSSYIYNQYILQTDRHDITEILLKVTLNTIIHPPNEYTTEPHS